MKKIILIQIIICLVFLLTYSIKAEAEKTISKIIDNFNSLQGWKIINEGLKISKKKGVKKDCICLDYDLKGNREWVVISKEFSGLNMPQNYKINFYIKGTGLNNTLEFKLIDKKGNVFWKKWTDFKFSDKWKKITMKKRDIKFGWGPDAHSALTDVVKIEFGISKGLGGKGKVYIDQLVLIPDKVNIQVEASSFESPDKKPENIIDGSKNTCWSSKFSDPQWIKIDLGKKIELIGITLYWETAYGKAYDILLSENEYDWKKVYGTTKGKGGIDDIDFKMTKARYIKILGKQRGTYWGYSLFEVVMKTAVDPWGEGEDSDVIVKHQWDFKTDPKNRGEKRRWYSASYKGEDWTRIKTGVEWEKQGFFNYDGIGWYRALFYIPEDWKNEDPILLLNDILNDYKLYINGRFVKRIKKGKNNKRIKIKKYIKINDSNLFVLKVNNLSGAGGIKGDVILIKNEKALKNKIQALKHESFKDYYDFLARIEPDGYFPYWLKKDQGFWTVVGLDEDYKESLFYEDGSIEPYKSFSISPFLYFNNKLITRSDVILSQSLEQGYLPVFTVRWQHQLLSMDIKVFPSGRIGKAVTYAWYKIKNNSKKNIKGKLFLTLRPFEINPPWQWGGFNKIYNIKYRNDHIEAGKYKIIPLSESSDFGVSGYKDDDITCFIKNGRVPDKKNLHDKDGFASGAIEFQYNLAPGKEKDFFIAIPLYKNIPVKNIGITSSKIKKFFIKMINKNIKYWESRLDNVEINIPNDDIVKTLKANLAYIFINKDGPAIQPGSRAYEAARIRDGAMTSASLLRMGYYKEVKEYLDWYSGYLYKDGRVPAIVIIGRDEVNPVKEYDSQGELIYAILQYYYFTRDKHFLKEKWTVVLKSLKYLEYLRDQRITGKYKNNFEKRRYYGILPMSVSHEGYYPEPGNHSYWDNFWALRGWKDAGKIAVIIGKEKDLVWINREEKELRKSLYESIKLTMKQKNISYIPGCAELGDFDPTSTAIAVMVCDELENLPQPQLENSFYRYFNDVLKRLKPGWTGSFTPYEVRSVQAFLYMNQKEKALKLLKYLLTLRRPSGWRHWAEAIYSPFREGGYIGDMPHTWVGSGYINTIRSLFVYEKEKDDSLILGAGIDENWLKRKEGISIKRFPTYYGKINYSIKKEKNTIKVNIWGDADPEKGFVFKSPFLKKKIRKVKINGETWTDFSDNEVFFKELSVDMLISY